MKATGIVRRIDDLGRVVIPKEIRRTLRIREGDPLEIFVDREGEVILKKYSPIHELGEFAQQYAEAIGQTTKSAVLICDRDVFVALHGVSKKEYYNKAISDELERLLNEKKAVLAQHVNTISFSDRHVEDVHSFVFAPIVVNGEAIGAVILFQAEQLIAETELVVAQTGAQFLALQMNH